ncbi:stalk domain-containing protein [Paenibacillus sp. B01]|uniref:stalk domain-containing protein n=1 Tax=Paenibacillus sp. B01 TaxID=2660554 RepID=UPI00129B04F3|nr:stalk domain-containing protein [Paenibacillus sp. B01]QGG57468.1 hypothetical protein GE073_18940 [Paenibacillus sp. B01]
MNKLSAFALSLSALALLLPASGAMAHGTVERISESTSAEARLFVADGQNGDLVTIDLPSGKTVSRLSTPASIMSLSLAPDARHLFVTRGRDTDKDYVTVVNTGFDPATGAARPPIVSRTFEGYSPDSSHPVAGLPTIANESKAELLLLSGDLDSLDGVSVRKLALAGNAHYHYAEAGGLLYVGHLQQGFVQVLDLESGQEKTRIAGCPVLHGIAEDEPSGRLLFGCQNGTLVVGTQGAETAKAVARIDYPEKQRVAAFLEGKDRVFWGYTEGTLPLLYKLDASRQPYAYETVAIEPSIRQAVSSDQAYLLSLRRSGTLEIRDSASGSLLRATAIGQGWSADFHEHVDKAVLPDIATSARYAYVSLPGEGRIAQVELASGKLVRYLEVGGEPTRLELLEKKGGDDAPSASEPSASPAAAEPALKRGDKSVPLAAAPLMQDDHAWLPLRSTAAAFGLRVQWQAGAGIAVSGEGLSVQLTIGGRTAKAGGKAAELHAPIRLVGGSAYIQEHDLESLLGIQLLGAGGHAHGEEHEHGVEHDHAH